MDEMNQNVGQESFYDPYAEKPKNNLPIILAIVAAIAVIGVVSVYLLMSSSPKKVYFDLEERNAKAFLESVESFGESDLGKFLFPDETKPIEVGVEMDVDVEVQEQNEIIDMLNNTKLSMIQQQDLENDYNFVNMNLIVDNSEFLNIDVLLNNNVAGILVKDLVDKYFVIDMQNLKPFYNKIGYTEQAPNRILTNKELKEKVFFTDSELKILKKEIKKYPEIFKNNLKDENIYLEKKVQQNINGEEVECNLIKVTITPEYAQTTAKEFITTLKEDEKILNILFSKYEALISLYEDAGYPIESEGEITKEEFINSLDDFLKELESVESVEDDGNLIMSVYYNNNKEIIKREIFLEDDYNPIIITNYEGKEGKYYAFEVDGEVISDEITIDDKEEIHNILLVDTKIKAVVDKSDKDRTEVEITSDELAGFTINTALYKENNRSILDMVLKFAVLSDSIELNTSMYVAENQKFEKVDFANQKVIDITKLSDTELQKELQEITTKVQKWAEKHSDVLMLLMGSYNPYGMYDVETMPEDEFMLENY